MVFPYHLIVRRIPGRLGMCFFYILLCFSFHILMEVKVKSTFPQGFLCIFNEEWCELLASPLAESSFKFISLAKALEVCVYGVAGGMGFLIAYKDIVMKVLRWFTESIELHTDEQWLIYFVLHVWQGCVEINWEIKWIPIFLILVSLCFCAIVCPITEGWSRDQTGFICVVAMVYLTLLSNNHKSELWVISTVLGVMFYSKVTESLLKKFLLRLGLNLDDEQQQQQQQQQHQEQLVVNIENNNENGKEEDGEK